MPIFDSEAEETEFETDEQAVILDEHVALGGDRITLEEALWSTGRFAAHFREDRRAAVCYVGAKNDEAHLLDALDGLRELKAACERTRFPIAPDIVERENMLRSRLDQVRRVISESDPVALARRRLAMAPPAERPLLERISDLRLRIVNLSQRETSTVNLIYPRELKAQCAQLTHFPKFFKALDFGPILEREDRAIRTVFIPYVIRTAFAVIDPLRPELERREGKRLGYDEARRPFQHEARQIHRKVSAFLNEFTARVVRAYYPTWGETVTPTRVRRTRENVGKSSSQPDAPAE